MIKRTLGQLAAGTLVAAAVCAADDAEIARKLNNPVSALISVPFQANWELRMGPLDEGTRFRLNFQPVIPLELSKDWSLIVRTIVPAISQEDVLKGPDARYPGLPEAVLAPFPGDVRDDLDRAAERAFDRAAEKRQVDHHQDGLGDISQSFFFKPTAGGAFGTSVALGPVFNYPTATDDRLGSERWSAGPTALVLKQEHGWTAGVLANHLWSFAGNDDRRSVNASFVQPFLSYQTKSHTTFGVNSEASYDLTQFFSPHVALAIGKLDPTGGDANEFAHIAGDERFVGAAFAANPVASLLAPYSALGATLLILPTKDLILSAGAIDGDGRATRTGFDTVWEGKTTYLAEARLTTHFFGKTGHQLVGGAVGSGSYGELDQPLRAFIPGSGVSLRRSDRSWAAYYNFDQYLWHPTVATDEKGGTHLDTTRGFGVFGRVGFADEGTNPIAQFYSLGFGGKGLGTARPQDRWGLGWYYLRTSRELPDFLHLGDEQGVEAFYNYAVTPAFLFTADVQLTDSAKEGTDPAVIGGVRATLRF